MNKYFAFLIILLSSFGMNGQTGETIDKVVAVVGNEIILKSEIELQALSATEGAPVTEKIRNSILEESLFNKILIHQAKIDSIVVEESEVEAEITRRLEYYIQVFGSEKEFEVYYGKSVAEWRDEFQDPITETLLAQKMQRNLLGGIKVTPGEVREFYKSLPKDSLPLINASVAYSRLVVTPEVSEKNKLETKHFMDSLRSFIASGGTSMTVQAAKWSEDPGSKYKGGCYPIQTRGSFVPEYEAAVYNTGEGGYSNVFESDYGYHFLHVKEIRGDRYEACHILMAAKPSLEDVELAEERIKEAQKKMDAKELKFDKAVLQYSNDEDTKNQMGKVISLRSGSPKLEMKEIDPNIIFILDKLENGEKSTPVLIQIPGQTQSSWAIFKLDKRTDAHIANLEQDYEIFQQQTESVKRQKFLSKWMNEKIEETYIRLDDDFAGGNFQYQWIKETN